MSDELLRNRLLEGLKSRRQSCPLWFCDYQVHVFRHYHITLDVKTIAATGVFERVLENRSRAICVKQRLPAIAAEGDEVKVL